MAGVIGCKTSDDTDVGYEFMPAIGILTVRECNMSVTACAGRWPLLILASSASSCNSVSSRTSYAVTAWRKIGVEILGMAVKSFGVADEVVRRGGAFGVGVGVEVAYF